MLEFKSLAGSLAKAQQSFFTGQMERAQLQVKVALLERRQEEIKKLDDKYDGREGLDLEKRINKMADRKFGLATRLRNVTEAIDKLTDVREKLYDAYSSAADGVSSVFDLKIESLNDEVGSATLDKNNLLGNTGQGTWPTRTTVVDNGVMRTTVQSHFVGTDYIVTLNDGRVLKPDFDNTRLEASDGTTIEFEDITLNSRDGSNNVEFTDGTTTYNGTVTFGGLGVGSAWLYNNLDTAADITDAQNDITTAFEALKTVESDLKTNKAILNRIVKSLSADLLELRDEHEKVTTEELDAKQAERRAISSRYDLTIQNLSLTSKLNQTFIANMFDQTDPFKKQTVLGIMKDAVKFT